MGWSLRGFEQVDECSEIDDIIVFRDNGTMLVTKVADKKFIGKGVLHVAVWKKNDERTIYHLVYQDGSQGPELHEALRRHRHHAGQGVRPHQRGQRQQGALLHRQPGRRLGDRARQPAAAAQPAQDASSTWTSAGWP
jgi:hypothetical protein